MTLDGRSEARAERDAVLALHRGGELDEARRAYERLLAASPGSADLTGLLGVLAMQQRRLDEAETLLTDAVDSPDSDPRIHLRNVNNLFALLRERRRHEAARELAQRELPDWPAEATPDASERRSILSLAEALLALGAQNRALALIESALGHLADDAEALALAGELRLRCGDPGSALPLLRGAWARDAENWRALANLSVAERALGNDAAARDAARRSVRAGAVYAAPQRDGQRATLLVLNRAPAGIPDPVRGLENLHFTRNYIAQIAGLMADEYRFASVFADLADPLPPLPAADIVVNNIASGEILSVPGMLDRALEVIRRVGRPVINHPQAVAQTTRQKTAELLQGIPGLKIPRILRFARDMDRFDEIAGKIATELSYPVILRHVAADQSSDSLLSDQKTAVRLQDAAEVRRFLETVPWQQFYAIEYVDLRKPDGNFRKLRAAVFPDEIFLTPRGCGFYSDWMVSGWRHLAAGQAFYEAFPERVSELRRILADPQAELGPDFLRVLEAIRERLPLDTYGIDFDIDDDGQVVIFEAQATMVLLTPSAGVPENLNWSPEIEGRINDAFRRLVAKKMAGPA